MSMEKKSKLLNARELIAVTNLQNEIESTVLVRGSKANFPEHTDEEHAIIKSYQDDLRKVLSLERVAPEGTRSIASLENGIIKIIKRTGKWEGFESTGNFLEPHEALFLIETNRLEVYMGKMIVSLERAYHTFLAHDDEMNANKKLTKMEYLVYSHFMRFGCHLKRFRNEMNPLDYNEFTDSDSSERDSNLNDGAFDKLYIWNYLHDLLGHRRSIVAPENIDRSRYARIKQSMNGIINTFKAQNQTDPCQSNQIVSDTNASDEMVEPPEKRRKKFSNSNTSNVECTAKLPKSCHKNGSDDSYYGSGSLNDFMIGNTFQRFKQIFDKIDTIELRTIDYDDDRSGNSNDNGNDNDNNSSDNNHNHNRISEKFSFDLWTSPDSRRSQSKPPNFRLIIKQPSKSLPHNDEIFKLYRSLICKSAIILVCINEEMSFQAYVYRFTT